jgi:pimeloyl-ACP methyl ester carboxylesterase
VNDSSPTGASLTVWSATSGSSGQRVVLVHGSLDRSAGMLKLSRRLDERYVVTRYDRRGYGRSLHVGAPFGMVHQVDDLLRVIGDQPAVVVGHSYGGNVALAAAQRSPQRVAGVVVYEPPLSWLPWWPSGTAGSNAREWAHDPSEAAERFLRRLIGDERWERLPASTRTARRAEGPALVGELTDLAERAPWEVDAIAAPVLAVCGERSQEHHRRATSAIGEWFGLPAVAIRGAKHFGVNTHPDEVAELVDRFVADLAA